MTKDGFPQFFRRLKRRLFDSSYCQGRDRHCQKATEYNVFSRDEVLVPPPTDPPTKAPLPSPPPTESPMKSPNVPPTAAPTVGMPAPATNSPTLALSTVRPTTVRSSSSSPTSSSAEGSSPVSERCTVDDEGNYGTTGNNNYTQQLVAFDYQVQTTVNQSVDQLNNGILSLLEQRLSALLAQVWFAECSAEEEGGTVSVASSFNNFRRWLQGGNASSITGLSSAPADYVRPGIAGGT